MLLKEMLTTRNKYTGKAILRNLPNYAEYDPIERLALYEETGLFPDEIEEMKNEGALFLPHTIGDITYYTKEELIEWVENQQKINKNILEKM